MFIVLITLFPEAKARKVKPLRVMLFWCGKGGMTCAVRG
jgi:hypothetical protein